MKPMHLVHTLLLVLVPCLGSAQATSCPEVAGALEILHAGTVIQLGEIHGTVESPEAIRQLACEGLERGLAVTVGLEITQSENERIQTYLQSEGTPWNRLQMLEGPFWQRDYQDGRSSRAMADLVEDLRTLARKSNRLRVLLIDNSMVPDRDLFMARWLKFAIDEDPERLYITLTGNLHSRQSAIDNRYFPMGFHLTQMFPDKQIVSLEITHAGGSAWVCTPHECGVQQLAGESPGDTGIALYPELSEAGVAGTYHVGVIQASPPAKEH